MDERCAVGWSRMHQCVFYITIYVYKYYKRLETIEDISAVYVEKVKCGENLSPQSVPLHHSCTDKHRQIL